MDIVDRTFIKRLALRNYKNIEHCDVELQALNILVGPNGSGKSNFLDALRFVSDSLRTTVYQALHERGGIGEVRRISRGHPTHFGIHVEFFLPSGARGEFKFEIGAKKPGGFEVRHEQCKIVQASGSEHFYSVESGKVVKSSLVSAAPVVAADRLYLTIASGLPEFRECYDCLTGMQFYNIAPHQMRELQDADSGDVLYRDGSNAASVLNRISDLDKRIVERIGEYLGSIVPGISSVTRKSLGHKESLEFQQSVAGDANPWSFSARSMSDGTLRALGILISLFQTVDRSEIAPVSVVGIEEPETALHPGAAGILFDALREASHYAQVIVTTHSPELLKSKQLSPHSLLVVSAELGKAVIGQADETSMSLMMERLFSAGELLVEGTLKPRLKAPPAPLEDHSSQLPLFPDFVP